MKALTSRSFVGGFALFAFLHCGAETGSQPVPGPDGGSSSDASVARDASTGEDASAENGPPEHCEMPSSLPEVPTPKTCSARPGADCLGGTWFCMSKWSPFFYDGDLYRGVPSTKGRREPRQLVWTPSFALDRYPVTYEAYASYLAEKGLPDPADTLDDLFYSIYERERPPKAQPSGWVQGKLDRRRREHPVVGVSRAEAQAYCLAKGGRLPSVVEVLRAGQQEAPLTQRFPWSNAFPYGPDGDLSVNEGYVPEVLAGQYPLNSPVTSMYADTGPRGTRGLATNVGEWLGTCEEEISGMFSSSAPVVLGPTAAVKSRCVQAALTTTLPPRVPDFDGQVIRSLHVTADDTVFSYLGKRLGNPPSAFDTPITFPHDPAKPGPRDPVGNDVRNFALGFRCAYEVP